MTTSLGLYGGPKTAYPSILTAFSTTIAVNIEVAGDSAVALTFPVNIEVAGQAAFAATKTVNIEVADFSVPGGAGGEGGTPDTILNLPTYAKASRLRADLFTWITNLVPPGRTYEGIGEKVGLAPLSSIFDFSYKYELDAVGEWSITIPANDENSSVIIDGTAKIIKLYYEDVGHIFTGIIDDYEIVDSETMVVSGRDMMFRLAELSSLWRIDTKMINYGDVEKIWHHYYGFIMLHHSLILNFDFHSTMPSDTVFAGNLNGEFIGLVPTYESQSVLDVFRDLNSASGAHLRIHPVTGDFLFGAFGDDSGIIIAPIVEDDPKVREEGALVLSRFSYLKSKEELVNMIVVQGSNDSFGIAVELRHSDRMWNYNIPYFIADSNSGGSDATLSIAGGHSVALWSFGTLNDQTGTEYPLDQIPTDKLIEQYEEALNPEVEDPVSTSSQVAIWGGSSGSGNFASIGFPDDQLVAAIPFVVDTQMYPTFASVMNMGGVGQFQMAIVPESGGQPDTSDIMSMRFFSSNYFRSIPPGNTVQNVVRPRQESFVVSSGVTVAVRSAYTSNGSFSRPDAEFGIVTEFIGFMDHGQSGHNGNPWPLLTPGNYYLLIWGGSPPATSIPGFPGTVHVGNSKHRLRLLRNFNGSKTAKYLSSDGTWKDSNDEIVMSIYGKALSSSYPYAVEGLYAEVVQDNGSGHRVFFIRDIDSIKTHGLRQGSVSFPSAIDASEGVRDIIPSSNLLHDMSQIYLARHKDPFEKITVTCTGLFRLPFVGQKVRFVYRGMALNENGEYKWLDINSDWYVLSIQWRISNEGLEHTLELTNVPEDIVSSRNFSAELARHAERSRNNLGELHIASRRLGDGITLLSQT